ncbi:MAG: lysophospholipid acyltransferase family protein [Pirellulales bacterium]|nr:lysophospholipid acyltransferase family protein [Pirellulales bacterium]
MKIRSPLLLKFGGLSTLAAIRTWMSTLDYKAAYYDRAVDPAFSECQGRKIFLFWHEYILFPLYVRHHCNIAMLLSRHQDAEVLSHVARMSGYGFIRGSTNRGGVTALREMFRTSRHMHLTITPDGPRGPRRHMAPGPIYLASKLDMPLVVMGFGYDRPWRFRRAWDQFAVPRPFSRARAIASGEIHVPPNLDRKGIEHYRHRVETLLNRLTLECEAWAAAGTRKQEQTTLWPSTAPLPRRRVAA